MSEMKRKGSIEVAKGKEREYISSLNASAFLFSADTGCAIANISILVSAVFCIEARVFST